MKKITALLLSVSLLSLILLISCDTRDSTGPGSGITPVGDVAEVTLTLPASFKALQGSQSVNIQGKAVDDQGDGVPDVALEFTRNPGYGYISLIDTVTDNSGIQRAQYIVDLQQTITENITVKVPDTEISASKALTITLLDQTVGSVDVTANPAVLQIGTGTEATVTGGLVATVKDEANDGISGLRVNFSSSKGVISNNNVTDNLGQVAASITFDSEDIPTGQNAISTWVKALLGGGAPTDSALITVVKNVENPDSIVVFAENPYIVVPQGTQGNTPIKAVVLDNNGNGVPGLQVNFTATGGYINQSAVTDTTGLAIATLNSLVLTGDITAQVTASVSYSGITVSDTTYVQFIALDQSIGDIYIYAEPPVITAQPGGQATTTVKAQVKDVNNIAIEDLQVQFQVDHGALTPPTLTDSTGIASTTYFSNGYIGQAIVTAIVGLQNATTTIQINSSGIGSLIMTTDKSLIYADGNVTYATVKAIVKNYNNEAIVNDTVRFTSSSMNSTISSPVVTDSSGTATSYFNDIGPEYVIEPETSLVIARYDQLGLADTLNLIIAPPPTVDYIEISTTAAGGMQGNGADTASVYAFVYLSNGEFAPTGTRVLFSANKGELTATDTIAYNGRAATKYISPQSTGKDTIRAEWYEDSTVYAEVQVPLFAGAPNAIHYDSLSVDTLYVGGDPGIIYATVVDTAGNGVPSKSVYWEATLGNVPVLTITDSLGHTMALLDPQTQAGVSIVTAKVPGLQDSLVVGVPIISGFPSSIQLSSDLDQLQVQGTGGQESAALIATVKDPNGNNVPDGIKVHFELLPVVPEGATFDNNTTMDSSVTYNGEARVSLNSGIGSGPVRLRATTWKDWPDRTQPISAEKSNITIASGPPETIDIDHSSTPEEAGANIHGASLKFEVSARVTDTYGNNVSQGTAVFFSIGQDSISPWYGPMFSHIDGTSTIEDSTGTAYTYLYYSSEGTFSACDIIAWCNRPDSTYATDIADSVVLPLWDGRMELSVDPESHFFTALFPRAVMKVTATLFDGFDNPINNAKVQFANSLGMFFCCDSASANVGNLGPSWYPGSFGWWRFIQYTGPNPPPDLNQNPASFSQQDGQAIMFMRAEEMASTYYPGVFTDPMTPEVVGEIHCVLVSDPSISSDPVSVTFRRSL
jgi:adhesin/invasin